VIRFRVDGRVLFLLAAAAIGMGLCTGCGSREIPPMEAPPVRPVSAEVNPSPTLQGPVTLDRAVEIALRNYPSIRSAQARADAAAAGIDLAGTAYLPRLDLLWQSVRSTRNNISGQFFPQGIVPAISGPVNAKSWDNAWGSMAGALATWEPFDFGFRGNQVELARSVARQSGREVELAKLDVALGTVEAFLILVAAEEAARAARANVERWEVFGKSVKALVDQQLRPGADLSRSEAELALARNLEIQAQQAVDVGRAALAESMGVPGWEAKVDTGPVLTLPAISELPLVSFGSHPLLVRQMASVQTIEARKALIDSSYAPRVGLQLSFSDRGSGFDGSGQLLDPADGLWPDRYNWAAGVTLTMPLMDYFGIEARSRQEDALARSERSRADEIMLGLAGQERRVRAVFGAARKIAENTPVQLKAAQEAHGRSRSRYDSGLGTLTEVAEGQRLLAQAEIDDALARLGIWRALAGAARVQGSVGPFLDVLSRTRKEK
jgi:outer membrane protein